MFEPLLFAKQSLTFLFPLPLKFAYLTLENPCYYAKQKKSIF